MKRKTRWEAETDWRELLENPAADERLENRLSKRILLLIAFSGLAVCLGWPLLSRLLRVAASVLLTVICALALYRRVRM